MKVYKQKINYYNLHGNFPKGTIWKSSKLSNNYWIADRTPIVYLPKDFVENNPDIFEDISIEIRKEVLLEEAAKRYPIGTKFKSAKFPAQKGLSDGKMRFHSKEDRIFTRGFSVYYNGHWAEIVEKPLFTTEDGVDIYKGDLAYSVELENMTLYSKGKTIYDSGFRLVEGFKYFSTEKKAQEYIDLNKPKYSKQDVIDAIMNADMGDSYKKLFNNVVLKELDKNK